MIKKSILLLNDIFSSFDWLDRYGLLASPVMRTYPVKDGPPIKETFPAATIASGVECDEKNLYYLVPDERWRSLAYWELMSDYRINSYEHIPAGDGIRVEFDARLVLWWNASALGFDDPQGVDEKVFFSIFTHLDGLVFNNPDTFSAVRVTYDLRKITDDKRKIFGRYSYRESHDWLFQPPNGFMAADFTIEIITTRNCLPELHIGNSSICNIRQSFTWDMAFPGVATDVYQRWISPGGVDLTVEFLVTDFDIPDLSNRTAEEINDMYLVFADGRRLSFLDQYSLSDNPDSLTIPVHYVPEGTSVELYNRS